MTCLVVNSTNEDLFICQEGFCYTCFTEKLKAKIFSVFPIDGNSVKYYRGYGVKMFRIKCECKK